MKNFIFAVWVGVITFVALPVHVSHAGAYEDCMAGRVPYTKPGTEAICGPLKTAFTQGTNGTNGSTQNPRGSGPTTPEQPSAPRGSGPAAPENAAPPGDLSYSLKNPLAFDSLEGFIVAILNVIIVIATPIVVIFIILAGFQYVTAQGNAEKVKKATLALTYAIIGGVLIIGAVAIAEIIKGLVTAFS